jgi:RNA polymerase sigma-70 factor, ECF subfamily
MERGPDRNTQLAERNLSADEVRRLYDQHGPALVAYACSIVVDTAAAEDVVHQLFLRLLHGDTPVPEVPAAYLYRAVRNGALNSRRNGNRTVSFEDHPLAAKSLFQHDDGNREAALALQAALLELPEEQREVVVLRIWSGLTLAEVADLSGVSLSTSASRYRYALEKLRERLKPHWKG